MYFVMIGCTMPSSLFRDPAQRRLVAVPSRQNGSDTFPETSVNYNLRRLTSEERQDRKSLTAKASNIAV
jgi:hypothetical protein